MIVLLLLISKHVYHLSSSLQRARARLKNRKLPASSKHNRSTLAITTSPQYLIESFHLSFIECNTPNPQTCLGNEGHINMCCANSCEGATLQGREVVPFTLDCHEIRGWFRWKSKTQPDHRRPRRQSGESTLEDVTTRQTRQKVSRNMFLPGAYKLLPGFSSPWPVILQHEQLCHTYTHRTHYNTSALMHADRHMHVHLCIVT